MINCIMGKLCPLSFSCATAASLLSQTLYKYIYILTGFVSISRWQSIAGNVTQLEHTYRRKLTHNFSKNYFWVCCFLLGKTVSLVKRKTLSFLYPLQRDQYKMCKTEQNCVGISACVCILMIFFTKS